MKNELNTTMFEKNISRRNLLKTAGIGGAGIVIGASGLGGIMAAMGKPPFTDDNHQNVINKVNFYGPHQSGISTKNPMKVYFVSLNCIAKSKQELQELFQVWTEDSVRLMNGETKESSSNALLPPHDTGEAEGLDASNLTLTFGVGPSLFEKPELGLQNKKPKQLKDLPHFPKDQLDPLYVGGDLCIQACANDPQVAFHAVRNLIRTARGKVTMKWSQAGFNSYPVDSKGNKETPRNLFAFKDGTVNPIVDNEEDMNKVVWVQPGESADWLTGGTYLVARRIQMHLETWDRTALSEQEATFGRHRDSGALIGKSNEFDEMEKDEKDANGNPLLPEDSHVYLARQVPDRILRRSFSYSDGIHPDTGAFDAGLLFISFQKNPEQFISIQNSLGRLDKMNEYITHRGSALFACFPGVKKGSYLGAGLFE